jgi:hypothetical protein
MSGIVITLPQRITSPALQRALNARLAHADAQAREKQAISARFRTAREDAEAQAALSVEERAEWESIEESVAEQLHSTAVLVRVPTAAKVAL